MHITLRKNQINFSGYDAIPLQGIYMQGLTNAQEQKIFKEMKIITKEEGLDLFLNQNNKKIEKNIIDDSYIDDRLSIWAQDNKAFVKNKDGKNILWNAKESVLTNIFPFNEYKINSKKYMPRGGNYFLGFDNDKKWMLINSLEIYEDDSFIKFGDKPTTKHLSNLFDVSPENIFTIDEFSCDLDEIVRPIGYPYILVNDYSKSLKNIENMKKEFPNNDKIYNRLKTNILRNLNFEKSNLMAESTETIIKKLKNYGFKPIKIGGKYFDDINFINAIAFKKQDGKISYITNSTKYSSPALEYLEKLFREDLIKKFPNINKIHFVSGGKHKNVKNNELFNFLSEIRGFKPCNGIMNILSDRLGGIHCMCSEIPKFISFR